MSEERLTVHVRLNSELLRKVDLFAAVRNVSRTEAVTILLNDGIKQNGADLVDFLDWVIERSARR